MRSNQRPLANTQSAAGVVVRKNVELVLVICSTPSHTKLNTGAPLEEINTVGFVATKILSGVIGVTAFFIGVLVKPFGGVGAAPMACITLVFGAAAAIHGPANVLLLRQLF